MSFIVKDQEGQEYGPVDKETLEKWAENGRVLPETPVRNALMNKWKEANDLDFLHPCFKVWEEKAEQNAGFLGKRKLEKQKKRREKKEDSVAQASQSVFKYQYLPNPAPWRLRMASAITDFALLTFVGIILYLVGVGLAAFCGFSPNAAFYLCLAVYLVLLLTYYGVGLGIFAQTVGMWFWGIFLVKRDLEEAYMARAYLFTLLMLTIGPITPLMIFVHPSNRSLHDIITGTWVIRIAAKPKA